MAALAYTKAGIPVFPCEVGGKRPATRHGFKDRTLDEIVVNSWWINHDYNIGIVPEDGGWCVVDVDPKNRGDETWAGLCVVHGEPVPRRVVLTPSGGYHLYFDGSLPPSSGKLGPGIDTRGRGSYVLAPPSVVNGVAYRVR